MKFQWFITFFIVFSFGMHACGPQANTPPHVKLQLIESGFTSPVALVAPQDGSDRLFVADQTGIIWVIANNKRLEKPFLDIRNRVVKLSDFYDERGLLGLAFHPDFAANGRFYVSYSTPLRASMGLLPNEWDHTTYISEFTVSADDSNQADATSERIIHAMDKPGYNYEAGHLAFGPDGYLYIATGDSVHDPASEAGQFAQDTFSLLGKILRIDVNNETSSLRGGLCPTKQSPTLLPTPDDLGDCFDPTGLAMTSGNYSIPTDNPFADGVGGLPEVYAYGFRNPYRFSFDVSDSGEVRLFVADVGQAMMEEINLVEPGKNYGWSIREGTSCFNSQLWSQPLEHCATQGLSEPILAYPHQGDLSAVIGGMVYHGKAIPELNGGYIFGDWGRGNGHLFVAYSHQWLMMEIQIEMSENTVGMGQLLGIGEDENGELYLLTKAPGTGATGDSGMVYKIVATE